MLHQILCSTRLLRSEQHTHTSAATCTLPADHRRTISLTARLPPSPVSLVDVDCLKLLISKLLGYAIITGALIVKLPQILKLISSGRADSIAPSMFVIENVGYTISCAYNSRMGYPFSTYGESVFLLLQGFVLVFLVFKINGQLKRHILVCHGCVRGVCVRCVLCGECESVGYVAVVVDTVVCVVEVAADLE